jgi:glutamyl/glutaminyl-tRNA synthetase
MKHNTRFNPTTNGPLHLGHIYTLLVNERLAHESGGKFYVRFDDTSPTPKALPPERVSLIMEQQRKDIEWLGVKVDGWSVQSGLMPMVNEQLAMHGHKFIVENPMVNRPYFVRMGNGWIPIHYVPQETSERVIMDRYLSITDLIRGEEFSTEMALYSYKCEEFGFPIPNFIFLPRLTGKHGDISKTNGGYTIAELRNSGYNPVDIEDMIAWACLWSPANGWGLENLRPNPRINL